MIAYNIATDTSVPYLAPQNSGHVTNCNIFKKILAKVPGLDLHRTHIISGSGCVKNILAFKGVTNGFSWNIFF